MIQTLLKRVPEGKRPESFLAEVNGRLPDFAAGADSAKAWIPGPAEFDELWSDQDNLKKTPEIESKYRTLTAAGSVVAVEIDW